MGKNHRKGQQHSTPCSYLHAGCLYPHPFNPPNLLCYPQCNHTVTLHVPHLTHPSPTSSTCTIHYTLHSIHTSLTQLLVPLFLLYLHRLNYDLLGEPSAVDPTLLRPAEQLQWSISSESARDIDIAKKNLDRCVHILALFLDSHHQESLGIRLCVCIV